METHPQSETSGVMSANEHAMHSGPNKIIWIIGFVVLAGSVIGLFLWWVWVKSPLVLWLKIVLTIIPFGLFIALV